MMPLYCDDLWTLDLDVGGGSLGLDHNECSEGMVNSSPHFTVSVIGMGRGGS